MEGGDDTDVDGLFGLFGLLVVSGATGFVPTDRSAGANMDANTRFPFLRLRPVEGGFFGTETTMDCS